MRVEIIAAVAGGFLVLAGIAGCATPDEQSETAPVGVVTRPANPDEDSMAASAVFSEDAVSWDGTTLTWRNEDYVIGQNTILGGGEASPGGVVPAACGDGPAWIVGVHGYPD